MAKKVLVIDESALFRDFIKGKLEEIGCEVHLAVSGLDGASKLRSEVPDLLITEFHLSRKSALDLLREKSEDPNVARIPSIVVSNKIDRSQLVEVARYNVRKFLTKPVRMDALLSTVGEVLSLQVSLDTTPCIIEAHVNDGIVFIEVAEGLNREKVDLLRYKLIELIDLYEIATPKILLIMTSVDAAALDSIKLSALFSTIFETTKAMKRHFKVLTRSDVVKEFVSRRDEYQGVEVTDNVESAMDGLLNRKVVANGPILQSGDVRHNVVKKAEPKKARDESINMQFTEDQRTTASLSDLGDTVRISIVDDDEVIQELIRASFADTRFQIDAYGNGRLFVESESGLQSDLVFLDLMMPEMNGFQVLDKLRADGVRLPVIVLSALSKRETVLQALKMGVSSYIIKPLQPQALRTKAAEVLQLNF